MRNRSDNYCAYCGAPLERMFSIKSCAELLDCSQQFFRNMIRDRRIGYSKVGGMVRIPHSELERIANYMPSMQEMVDEALLPRN
ncbi:helix-turn-helix domain-containing protein [Candidatus Neomarinimicrobiota bacterium]